MPKVDTAVDTAAAITAAAITAAVIMAVVIMEADIMEATTEDIMDTTVIMEIMGTGMMVGAEDGTEDGVA